MSKRRVPPDRDALCANYWAKGERGPRFILEAGNQRYVEGAEEVRGWPGLIWLESCLVYFYSAVASLQAIDFPRA